MNIVGLKYSPTTESSLARPIGIGSRIYKPTDPGAKCKMMTSHDVPTLRKELKAGMVWVGAGVEQQYHTISDLRKGLLDSKRATTAQINEMMKGRMGIEFIMWCAENLRGVVQKVHDMELWEVHMVQMVQMRCR